MQNMKHVQSSIDNNTKVAITAEQMFMNANGFNIDLYGQDGQGLIQMQQYGIVTVNSLHP